MVEAVEVMDDTRVKELEAQIEAAKGGIQKSDEEIEALKARIDELNQ